MTSLQEVYVSVKGLIATNLSTMGVTGYSSSDGLTTLANAILDIEGGSDLTIDLDLVSSSQSINYGQTVNLTATLTATYDGTTVDLDSVLKNAPITFKQGNTTINTVSTNSNGVATISNYAPTTTGSVTLSAEFPTTDGFSSASDSVTVTVIDVTPVPTSISLTSDKSILSYADSESATLSATLLDQYDDPMANKSVSFFKVVGESVVQIGNATTDSSGVATMTYTSTGVGDVSFYADYLNGSLVSESYEVEDCVDVITGLTDETSKFGQNISLRSSGSCALSYDSTNHRYTLTSSHDGESCLPLLNATGLNDFTIEFDAYLQNIDAGYGFGTVIYQANNNWGSIGVNKSVYTIGKNINGSYTYSQPSSSIPASTWLHFKVTYANDGISFEIYNGSTLVSSKTDSYSSSWFTSSTKYCLGIVWFANRFAYFKNIKVKPL